MRAAGCAELDRLVEHRNERVEALDRELLLPEERAAEVRLECLDLREALEQLLALLAAELLPEAARLDRLPEPDALGVVGDVLDLVGNRPGVDLAQPGQHVEQRLAGDVEAEQLCGDARLELRRQRRSKPRLVERGVAHRLRAEGIEPCVQVAVCAVRLDERHRGRDACEQLLVDGGRSRRLLRELLACSGGRGRALVHLVHLVHLDRGGGRWARPRPGQAREAEGPRPLRRRSRRSPPASRRAGQDRATLRGRRRRRARTARARRGRPPPGSRDTARAASRRSPRSGPFAWRTSPRLLCTRVGAALLPRRETTDITAGRL